MKPTLLMDIQDARADAQNLEYFLSLSEEDLLTAFFGDPEESLKGIMRTFEDMRREIERLEAKLEVK